MWAIVLAVVTAAIGFLLKIGHDIRTEHQGRKAVAAALAGELGAYVRLGQWEKLPELLTRVAQTPREQRVIMLRGLFSNLPSGHPVFDRISDKIGVLSPEVAQGISEAYNIVTGGRLALAAISSDSFLSDPDDKQVRQITAMVSVFAPEIPGVKRTIALLERLSRQSFRCYLMGCDCSGA